MRGNPIRAAVSRGEVQFGTWINMVRNPGDLELLAGLGRRFESLQQEIESLMEDWTAAHEEEERRRNRNGVYSAPLNPSRVKRSHRQKRKGLPT